MSRNKFRQVKEVQRKPRTNRHQVYQVPQEEPNYGTVNLVLKHIKPMTINQSRIFRSYADGDNILVHGLPGTGKSFLALYLGLSDVFNGDYDKVTIIRSTVPTRDMGFQKGTLEEKVAPYESTYVGIFSELLSRKSAYEILKQRNQVEFVSTAFLRGTTIRRSVIVVDEIQNMTFQELDTIITRVGEGSRIVFCGDLKQTDFLFQDERDGLGKFMKILNRMDTFNKIEMGREDIVRSGIVKDYILARDDCGY